MGLHAMILKPSFGDCSNKGISSRCDTVTIVNVEGPFKPDKDAPGVKLVKRRFGNIVAVPEGLNEDSPDGVVMFGGCYVETSDSRFNEAVRKLSGYAHGFPVALHDRFETWKEYELYSR